MGHAFIAFMKFTIDILHGGRKFQEQLFSNFTPSLIII